MKSNSENTLNIFINPIDEIEKIISAYEFKFSRENQNQLSLEFNGLWNNYEVCFNWLESYESIRINNNFSFKVPLKLVKKIQVLISLLNEKVLLGYFGYSTEEMCVYFRHNISMRGVKNLTTEQIEDFIDTIIQESDKYYPAFQIFLHKSDDPHIAIKTALLDTIGEA